LWDSIEYHDRVAEFASSEEIVEQVEQHIVQRNLWLKVLEDGTPLIPEQTRRKRAKIRAPHLGRGNRMKDPTPDEIARRCIEVQASWTEKEKAKRIAGAYVNQPVVLGALADMGGGGGTNRISDED
jgi:hypothetical protein